VTCNRIGSTTSTSATNRALKTSSSTWSGPTSTRPPRPSCCSGVPISTWPARRVLFERVPQIGLRDPQDRAHGARPLKVVTQVESAPPVTLDQHVAAVLAAPSACRRVLKELEEMAGKGVLDDPRWRGAPEAATGLARRFYRRPWLR
jgi:hypothetical protein